MYNRDFHYQIVTIFIFVIVSIVPFYLGEVDKTGLAYEVDNKVDKYVRIIWFLSVSMIAIMLSYRDQIRFIKSLRWFDLLIIFYCMCVLISIIYNGLNITSLYRLAEYYLIFVVLSRIKQHGYSPNLFSNLLIAMGIGYLLVLILGSIFDLDRFYSLESQQRYRLGGHAYSPNMIGLVFSLSSISCYYKFLYSNRYKILFAALFFGFILGMYLTGSRTAIGAFILAVLFLHFLKSTLKSRIQFFLITILISIIIIFQVEQSAFTNILLKLGTGKNPLEDLITLNNRLHVFIFSIEGIQENYLFGVGFVKGVSEYFRSRFDQSFWVPLHSHNALIENFLGSGIAAFLLSIILFIPLITNVAKPIKESRESNGDWVLLSSVSLIMILASMTTTAFGGIYTPLTGVFFLVYYLSQLNQVRHKSLKRN